MKFKVTNLYFYRCSGVVYKVKMYKIIDPAWNLYMTLNVFLLLKICDRTFCEPPLQKIKNKIIKNTTRYFSAMAY